MKTLDRPVLRLEPRDSPRTVSTGETSLRKISKVVASRDTNHVFGRVDLQEEVRTSRHIIQHRTTRNIPLAHPSRPLMLPVQFPQGDDTGLRDGPDRHARTRPSSILFRRHYDRKGLDTIIATLLLVVIVVVMTVIVYSWSLGVFGAILPTPPTGREI